MTENQQPLNQGRIQRKVQKEIPYFEQGSKSPTAFSAEDMNRLVRLLNKLHNCRGENGIRVDMDGSDSNWVISLVEDKDKDKDKNNKGGQGSLINKEQTCLCRYS